MLFVFLRLPFLCFRLSVEDSITNEIPEILRLKIKWGFRLKISFMLILRVCLHLMSREGMRSNGILLLRCSFWFAYFHGLWNVNESAADSSGRKQMILLRADESSWNMNARLTNCVDAPLTSEILSVNLIISRLEDIANSRCEAEKNWLWWIMKGLKALFREWWTVLECFRLKVHPFDVLLPLK